MGRLLENELAAEVDRRIVEGYTLNPQTAVEDEWAAAGARDAVEDEPW